MKSVINTLAGVVVAFTASFAQAQPFLKFHMTGAIERFSEVVPFEIKLVFDVSETPNFSGTNYNLNAVYAEITDMFSDLSVSPMIAGDPSESLLQFGAMQYVASTDELTLFAGGFEGVLTITSLQGDFSDIANSFPSDPQAYLVDAIALDASMNFSSAASSGEVTWTLADGFTGTGSGSGGFVVRVREVEDPNAPEPCAADINNDGFIDFFDISAYLQLYSDGCP